MASTSEHYEQLLASPDGFKQISEEWKGFHQWMFEFFQLWNERWGDGSMDEAEKARFHTKSCFYKLLDGAMEVARKKAAMEAVVWGDGEPDLDDQDDGRHTSIVEGIERRGVSGYANL